MTTEKKTSSKWVTFAIEAAVVLVAILIGLIVRVGIYETAIVTSGSMENTLQLNDTMLIDHRAALHGNWQRGDLILFNDPTSWKTGSGTENGAPASAAPAEAGDELVKRVIGLPGERIDIVSNQVLINNVPLNETYLKEPMQTDNFSITLGENQYFVMGDNRNNSDDSRFHGAISDSDIIGRAVKLISPMSRFGSLPEVEYSKAP